MRDFSDLRELGSVLSPRYPTAAELDAYAQRTADSPLSIKIFPSNIRVPQQKQINRTVNGLDTTGQRFSPYSYPYSGGYQGLLAIVKAPTVTKGLVKNSEGKRTKLSPAQIAVAPYAPPANGSVANRHRLRPYDMALCKPPEVPNIPAQPNVIVGASAVSVSGGQSLALAPRSDLPVRGIVRQMSRPSRPAQGPLQSGDCHLSPSHQVATAAACTDSSFAVAAPPHSSLGYSGAVLPTQTADMAKAGAYMDSVDYSLWQHKHPRQQQQQYQHGLQLYGASSGGGGRAPVSWSPEVCVPVLGSAGLSFRSHPLGTATGGTNGVLDKVGSSPLNCAAMHGEFSVSQFFAPPPPPPLWNTVLTTPDGDSYNPQDLPASGAVMGRACDSALARPHGPSQHYPPDRGLALCCGLPGKNLCHASVLSSSLQSLECLISEIHPPCIKERMLGRGYEALGMPHLLDHQSVHVQLPVFR
ncbi:protein FAM222A-like isoform X2 [Chanos chanos]|uniref:Protein FAM222A-like isoform X2 n=1 Tax=Chanos chanos TaxID=29144 RepID=A0A6J2V152_CHACN|nr:protein FAM222A-like isoform X2 [Chanos chanos]